MKQTKKITINGEEIDASLVTDANGNLDKELVELIHLEQQHNKSQAGQKQPQAAQIFVNGQNFEGFNNLPPDVQQKLQEIQKLMPELLSGNPLDILKNLGKMKRAGSAFIQLGNMGDLQSLLNGKINNPNQQNTTISMAPGTPTTPSIQTQQASQNPQISTTPSFDSKKPAEQPFRATTANHTSSYNPIYQPSKGDGWRKLIIVGVIGAIAYLAYEYFSKGTLPF